MVKISNYILAISSALLLSVAWLTPLTFAFLLPLFHYLFWKRQYSNPRLLNEKN